MATSALLLGSAAGCAHHGCHKAAHGAHDALGGIVVNGTGEAQGKPDLARSSVGIEVRAASVQEATQQANAQMANLLRALKEQGIADADLRTHGYSVSFDREYRPPQPIDAVPAAVSSAPAAPAKTTRKAPTATAAVESAPAPAPEAVTPRGSYVVSNMVEVTIRNVDKLGDVLAAATAAGANNVWGISFDVSDKRPLMERARAQAFENARADAERLAELSGVKLGKLTLVSDGPGGPGHGPVLGYARVAQEAVPVERGELTITHQVELHYAIAHDREHGDKPKDEPREQPQAQTQEATKAP